MALRTWQAVEMMGYVLDIYIYIYGGQVCSLKLAYGSLVLGFSYHLRVLKVPALQL